MSTNLAEQYLNVPNAGSNELAAYWQARKDAQPKRVRFQRADGICRYMSQGQRIQMWNKEIPEGQRLGWTCHVPYCGNPDHFELAPNGNGTRRDYRAIRTKLSGLKEGEWFDLLDEPNDGKSLVKFRCGLGAIGPHFLARALPRQAGIRIIRYGEHYDGQDVNDYIRAFPILTELRKPTQNGQKPGCFYLGILWGCWEDKGQAHASRCSIKGCAYPALPPRGVVCRYHSLDELKLQYHRNLDSRDMAVPKEYPFMPLDLYKAPISWDKRGFLSTTTFWPNRPHIRGANHLSNAFEKKSTAEKINDKWWKENVIEKGLVTDADGIMHKFGSELQLQGKIEEATHQTSMENIRAFFRNGAGAGSAQVFKHRLGGGRGKIRKKQRSRPAGWVGHRDDTKSNRPDREVIELESDWEVEDGWEAIEDDYSEEARA